MKYQIRILCTTTEYGPKFWHQKELSKCFNKYVDALNELEKYKNKTHEEIKKMCNVTNHTFPYIHIFY